MALEDIIREKHSGDDEQLNFIFSDDKNIIVTAPAGCGKTTAMVSKIARELSVGHIPSNKKVLAITFSVNAAMKIKDSLKTLLPDLVENPSQFLSKVDVANYHNFAMKILFPRRQSEDVQASLHHPSAPVRVKYPAPLGRT